MQVSHINLQSLNLSSISLQETQIDDKRCVDGYKVGKPWIHVLLAAIAVGSTRFVFTTGGALSLMIKIAFFIIYGIIYLRAYNVGKIAGRFGRTYLGLDESFIQLMNQSLAGKLLGYLYVVLLIIDVITVIVALVLTSMSSDEFSSNGSHDPDMREEFSRAETNAEIVYYGVSSFYELQCIMILSVCFVGFRTKYVVRDATDSNATNQQSDIAENINVDNGNDRNWIPTVDVSKLAKKTRFRCCALMAAFWLFKKVSEIVTMSSWGEDGSQAFAWCIYSFYSILELTIFVFIGVYVSVFVTSFQTVIACVKNYGTDYNFVHKDDCASFWANREILKNIVIPHQIQYALVYITGVFLACLGVITGIVAYSIIYGFDLSWALLYLITGMPFVILALYSFELALRLANDLKKHCEILQRRVVDIQMDIVSANAGGINADEAEKYQTYEAIIKLLNTYILVITQTDAPTKIDMIFFDIEASPATVAVMKAALAAVAVAMFESFVDKF